MSSEPIGTAGLLAEARGSFRQLSPVDARREMNEGAALVDIRSDSQIERDGTIPGSVRVPRNALEWRLEPGGDHCIPALARRGRRIILLCDEGYASSLAAATLVRMGLDATDVEGGFQAWRGAESPSEASVTRG